MALTRRELKREIAPEVLPGQLSLFVEFGPNPDQRRPNVDPTSTGRRQRGTVFPIRGGCPLRCTCDACLNGRP